MPTSLEIRPHAELPPDWGALAGEAGGFYHEREWIEGLARHFRFQLHVLVARSGAGRLEGGLALAEIPRLFAPRRLVSFPFSYACGPIVREPSANGALCAAAVELARSLGITRLEIKHRHGAPPPAPAFERVHRYATYRVGEGTSVEQGWERMHGSSTRRGIRKAEQTSLRVEEGGSSERRWREMAILQDDSSRRHGLPSPPHDFFTGFCARLAEQGLARLLLARGTAGVEAGIVVWTGAREWIYAFGASRPAALEMRPNHLLIWRAMTMALSAGKAFDLGRAAPEQQGLSEFKRRWGAERLDLPYDYWPRAFGLNVGKRDRGALAAGARVWSALPAGVARLGSFLYRYLG